MTTTNERDRSLAELEREAARNRAELMSTVDALQDRIAPSAIKQDVQDYVRGKKNGMLSNLERRARENPLQTAVFAAGAAYPLWRIVTSLPAPLLLIGAGLALTRRSGQGVRPGALTEGFVSQGRERVGEATDAFKEKIGDLAETAQQAIQSAHQTVGKAAERVSSLGSQAMQGAEGFNTKTADKLSGAADTARTMSSDAATAASDMASSAYRSGADAAERAGEHVMQAGQRTQETFIDTVQRHPMLVGAVGLAIGAVIAAALPGTRQEEQLVREVGDELKNRATDLAFEGLDAVKGAAKEVFQETLKHAQEQGLSAEGVQDAAKSIGEKVKSVMANATEGYGQASPAQGLATNPTTQAAT
jgi:hypothetical protein